MIEELFKLVQKESQAEIIGNPAIPNEQNNEAVGLATESVYQGLQNTLASGGLKEVLGMFSNDEQSHTSTPLSENIKGNFIGRLVSKLGLDGSVATAIAASLIPRILGKLGKKTADPNDDSFDINSIIGALTGRKANSTEVALPGVENGNSGGGIDFGGILKSLTGGSLDKNRDGKINLDDLSALVSGVTSEEQLKYENENNSGGIFDMIKKLTGK